MSVHAQTEAKTITLMIGEALNENGEAIALKPENKKIIDYIEGSIGVHFDLQRLPIPRLIEGVKQGNGIAFGVSKTSERLKTMIYSDVIFTDYVWLIVRDDSAINSSNIEALRGKSLGIVRGTHFNDEIDHQRNVVFKVEEDPSQLSSRLRKLLSGRMDAMLLNSRIRSAKELEMELSQYMVDKKIHLNLNEKPGIRVISKPFLADDVYFVTGIKSDKSILKKINAAMAKGRLSGDLPELHQASQSK
ncbi:substrate-binding periplasmic protein [Undibacterium sp. Ji67W]|uniref:substrate-binding periplasmic protein n=1 Tax=Undibacterium sp. Ji67W TaxID=3413042 RepID=UPI003BF23936